jgi:hypothetical protein
MNIFNSVPKKQSVGIVFINGSCCYPGMAPLEEQSRQLLDQIIAETGVPVEIKTISAVQALRGGVPITVLTKGLAKFQQEKRPPLPAVLIGGKIVASGVLEPEAIRSALLHEYAKIQIKEK